jgi:uncharacterized protein (DUF1697 family)
MASPRKSTTTFIRLRAAGYTVAEMPVLISMLRGVNVGGHNKVKMDALLALYRSLGLRDPRAYVQSGNVVFKTKARSIPRLADQIEEAIEHGFGFRPSVILRTPGELRDVIVRNPFADRPGIEPGKLLVSFLACDPGAECREKVLMIRTAPEELFMDGRELYVYFPNGMARPKMSWAAVERAHNIPSTGRNWNTVTKLIEIAEELEISERGR